MITAIKRALGLSQSEETIGSVVYWAGLPNRIPMYFIPCDGRSLDVKQYVKLYSIIGNRWGGDGKTFNLPDLRARDSKGNVDPADPWNGKPMALICYEGMYPYFD